MVPGDGAVTYQLVLECGTRTLPDFSDTIPTWLTDVISKSHRDCLLIMDGPGKNPISC